MEYGYKKFLEDYPEVIEEIYFDIESQTPNILKNKYPSELTVTDIFYDIYTPIFKEYVSRLCTKYKEEITKYPIYTGSNEYNQDKYMNRVNYLIRSASPKIYYGVDEKIISIAEEEFKGRVEFYNTHHRKKLREIKKFNSIGPSAEQVIDAAKKFGRELELIEKSLDTRDIKILFPDEEEN